MEPIIADTSTDLMSLGCDECVTVLGDDESWALLSSVTRGRLATAGQADIFPVNFVVQRHGILIQTAEWRKLFRALANSPVAFEAADHDVSRGWSVVVEGHVRVLDDHYLRITPTAISGRRFRCGSWQPQMDTDTRRFR